MADDALELDDERATVAGRHLAQSLERVAATGDTEQMAMMVLALLRPQELPGPYVDTPRIEAMVEALGGYTALRRLLDPLLTPPRDRLTTALTATLFNDRPTVAEFQALERLLPTPLFKRTLVELAAIFVGTSLKDLLDLISEVLQNAKRFYGRQADQLADDGYPVLAGMLATMSDLLLPETPLDLALSIVPVGRLGAAIKIVGHRAAARIAVQAGPAGVAAARAAADAARKKVDAIFSPLQRVSNRTLDELADLAARHSDLMEDVIQVLNKAVDDVTPKVIKEFEARTLGRMRRRLLTRRDAVLDTMLRAGNQQVRVAYEVLADGRVVQVIETRIQRRVGRRLTSASDAAKNAGLHATLKDKGLDWGHLAPDVLGGENAPYNLVLMSSRFNRSVYKNVDRLVDETPALDGQIVRIYAEFSSVEMARTRIASGIVLDLPGAPGVGPRFIVLGNPLNQPGVTFGEAMKGIDGFVRKASRLVE